MRKNKANAKNKSTYGEMFAAQFASEEGESSKKSQDHMESLLDIRYWFSLKITLLKFIITAI